jgi:hypothetical protein
MDLKELSCKNFGENYLPIEGSVMKFRIKRRM